MSKVNAATLVIAALFVAGGVGFQAGAHTQRSGAHQTNACQLHSAEKSSDLLKSMQTGSMPMIGVREATWQARTWRF